MSGSIPQVNLPKFSPSSVDYNPTGLLPHYLANASSIAQDLSFQKNKNDLSVQRCVKTQLNVKTPIDSLKSYVSSFFGGDDSKKGAYLYTHSELSNLCEPPPERYEKQSDKELLHEAFTIKTYMPSSDTIAGLKPNDVVTGKFRNESEISDFVPLDILGTIVDTITDLVENAAIEAFEASQEAQPSTLSDTSDCTRIVGSDFEKFLEPCDGNVGSRFGYRIQPAGANKGSKVFHGGQDIGVGQGKPVYAVYGGKVTISSKTDLDKEIANLQKAIKEGNESAARESFKVFGQVKIEHEIVNGLPGVFTDNYNRENKIVNENGKTELKAGKYYSNYIHLSAIYVNYGQQVASGTLIGLIGGAAEPYSPGTGRDKSGLPLSTGPHLHFELLESNGLRIDPVTTLGWGKTIKGNARCKTLDNPPQPPTSSVEYQSEVDTVVAQAIEQSEQGFIDSAVQTAAAGAEALERGARAAFSAINPFD